MYFIAVIGIFNPLICLPTFASPEHSGAANPDGERGHSRHKPAGSLRRPLHRPR